MTERFPMTWETVTAESAENGDVSDRGWVTREGSPFGAYLGEDCVPAACPGWRPYRFSLRDALSAFVDAVRPDGEPHRGDVEAVEASDTGPAPRWLTVYRSADPETGESLSLSLHFPSETTPASRGRVAALVRASL